VSPAKTAFLAAERTRYKRFMPKFCVEFIDRAAKLRADGATIAMISAELGVSVSAVKRWKSPVSKYFNADFAIAWRIADAPFIAKYEKIGISELSKPTEYFNAVLYSMFMRNNGDWTEHRKLNLVKLANARTFIEQKTELGKLVKGTQITAHELNYLTKTVSDLEKLEQIEKLQKEIDELKLLIKSGGNHEAYSSDKSGS